MFGLNLCIKIIYFKNIYIDTLYNYNGKDVKEKILRAIKSLTILIHALKSLHYEYVKIHGITQLVIHALIHDRVFNASISYT